MISKPWFDQYDPWVPHEIDADAYSNVVDMLMEAGERFSDNIAYSNFGAAKTYAEILSLSRDFAAYLQNELGVGKGDRVALMAPYMMAFPVAMLGVGCEFQCETCNAAVSTLLGHS
jgi:long-chain acyl-CoA synthetase